MDTIFIQELEVQAIIGLYDWEREKTQALIISLEISTDFTNAIDSDSLNRNIDYAKIVHDIEQIAKDNQFLLLEPFAEKIAQHILSKYCAKDVHLQINKPEAIKQAKGVGIKIKRSQQQLVVVSIGSNLSRNKNIQSAITSLSNSFHKVSISPIYETKSVGFDGRDFYNLVASFESALSANQIIYRLKQIEKAHGRAKNTFKSGQKYSDRTLDIDLLLYGDEILYEQGLDVPRNEIINYAFVLKPLADLLPESLHPILRQNYFDLWQDFEHKSEFKQVFLK
ncbi:MAG: 2-amino-4-hydroxy-6-hydroxymethyldihydropteridine diphosphokinase [Gammaproteobacteria bacterium]|nr:2-amino-4-hydroxy-6-hydroxymethyldihydropteridine diphosphokinase [Gammaproteobacteria bacterium]